MLTKPYPYSKLIGCRIHDSIRASPLALKIIDTKEFQRMRNIKQLALCHFVYPAATHTRFEHSIGVYHLAGKILDTMQQQYPNRLYNIPDLANEPIKLTPLIIECIKIAGLCHDIGHGPFSHIFDDLLLKKSTHTNKTHEVRSCLIIDKLFKRELSADLDFKHIEFIKSIINPQPQHTGAIYQIVSNYLNGIDVDKFDYLARDAKTIGLATSFNFNRLINEFIIDHNGNIAYPKHYSTDIFEMFHSRYMMHKKVYSHKTVKLIEIMLCDLFTLIDPIFGISKSIENMDMFCELTDDTIFDYIKLAVNPLPIFNIQMGSLDYQNIKKAHSIYEDIMSRRIYQCLLEIIEDDINKIGEQYLHQIRNKILSIYPDIVPDDLVITKSNFGYVSSNIADPFESIFFYDKKENIDTFTIKKTHISALINNQIHETHWYLICKNRLYYDMIKADLKTII